MLKRGIKEQLKWLEKKKVSLEEAQPVGILFSIKINVDNKETPVITRNTNESYQLSISYSDDERTLSADITANNYFGARHGIESLFQLMEYDDIGHVFVILRGAEIKDYPEFKHRGITLDTSRNFMEPDVIKRIIDGMGHSKVTHKTSA
jgi:hexosaminidase